ncbi:MAG: AlwI family type II restriction endonuclease, partial [Candidatus Paceibacterota bacterium]
SYIDDLRETRKDLQEQDNHIKSQPVLSITQYIEQLEKIFEFENRALMLEYLSTMGLHALNDAKEIKPNYPVGDDNEPTSTAPGGMADIECFYEDFNMICEVTMLKGRDQWFNEGQPVMRHLRDFENSNKNAYCIFIAPTIHTDSAETFHIANTVGYKGVKQKIAPLTIKQFIDLLKTLKKMREANKQFTHNYLKNLVDEIVESANSISNSDDWVINAQNIVNYWSESLVK